MYVICMSCMNMYVHVWSCVCHAMYVHVVCVIYGIVCIECNMSRNMSCQCHVMSCAINNKTTIHDTLSIIRYLHRYLSQSYDTFIDTFHNRTITSSIPSTVIRYLHRYFLNNNGTIRSWLLQSYDIFFDTFHNHTIPSSITSIIDFVIS